MIRVVLDTNVVVSGTYWNGDSRKVLKLVENEFITAIASLEIVKEYRYSLECDEILEKIDELQVTQRASTIKLIQKMSIVVPKIEITRSKDPDDNKFLEVAVESNAQFIISQDHHLLDLKEYNGIQILTPKDFLNIYFKDGGKI